MRTYYINGIATLMKINGGCLALYDDQGIYNWGEFISDADFNEDAFYQVEFKETDFTNLDAFYQREITEQINLEII